MTVRGYQLAVDWSAQGTYANTAEDVSPYVNTGDLEVSWGRSVDGDVTLESTSGSMTFALNNDSAMFSPENTSSPLTGKVLPGRTVRLQATAAGATSTLLQGVLDDFDDDGDPLVFTGTALDGWGRPGGEKLSTPLYRGVRTGDAVGIILDAIGWTGPRDLDVGATVMPWWWAEGDDATTAIRKLVNSEGSPAIAYVEGGTFVFRDRHHRIMDARSLTSTGTFTHRIPATGLGGSDFKIEAGTFRYNHGLKTIVNSATFAVGVRAARPYAEVWSSTDPVTIAAGATLQIIAQGNDPFFNATVPSVEGGDIDVQSGAVSAVSLSRTSGQAVILSVTCSAATVITRMAIRAFPAAVVRTVQVTAKDPGSIGRYGTQEWSDDAAPDWAGPYDAQVIADRIVAIYATNRPSMTFTVASLNSTYLAAMLTARVSDRVTVINDRRGINSDFMVERVAHRITSLGVAHRLTVTCQAVEPAQPANIFTFDTAGQGFNDGLFGVDGIDSPGTFFKFDTAGQGFDQGVFAH